MPGMNAAQAQRLIIISGLSGAGKSVALHTLEDAGFYCIDNLPVRLLPHLVEDLPQNSDTTRPGPVHKLALGIDAREPASDLKLLPEALRRWRADGFKTRLVFISAARHVLADRFSETRRRHPLLGPRQGLEEALRHEQEMLGWVAELADLCIDTSNMTLHELRSLIRTQVAELASLKLELNLVSFGYRHGLPGDAAFVFDVRSLPNPYWDKTLRSRSGLDPKVAEFLEQQPSTKSLVRHIHGLLKCWLEQSEQDNRPLLAAALGCTGGQHRSVYMAERLGTIFRSEDRCVSVRHRELERGKGT